jgi:hypothetical protein
LYHTSLLPVNTKRYQFDENSMSARSVLKRHSTVHAPVCSASSCTVNRLKAFGRLSLFPAALLGATLEVDGKKLVAEGRLMG